MCAHYPLIDIEARLHPHSPAYTHHSGYHNTSTRIDYWLLSPGVVGWVDTHSTLPRTFSDHSPLLLTLLVPRLGGYERQWRFPGKALADPVFKEDIRKAIEDYFELNSGTVDTWATLWEGFKATIRGVCISKYVGSLREIRAAMSRIEDDIAALDSSSLPDPDGALETKRLGLLQDFRDAADRELHYLHTQHAARQHGEGDRPGRLLAQLLRPPPAGLLYYRLAW